MFKNLKKYLSISERFFPILFLSMLGFFPASLVSAEDVVKSNLKVLYVGYNPGKPVSPSILLGSKNKERTKSLIESRSSDFERFLKSYFSNVSVVYVDDYQEDLSKDYDVTIIDGYLPELPNSETESSDAVFTAKKYLTDSYDYATIMIGEPSARIGQGRQLKIDHLCLCLDAHAHGMKVEHPIFNRPYKVDFNYESIETPSNYKTRYSGRDLGDAMSVWRVQTEGYKDGKGFPVGLVSTGYGFDNGIDAEWISSGICDKGVEATAIGRHANFLHWGFIASPEYMTGSARLAFINAIHYMASYNGAKQITRKIKGVALKSSFREREWGLSDQGAAANLNGINKIMAKMRSYRDKIKRKKASGEILTEMEESVLSMPAPEDKTREWTLRQIPDELKKQFGTDWSAYEEYYAENADYMYAIPGEWYQSALDEDAKEIGIPINRVELLEKCVLMLSQDAHNSSALGILKRYTNERYDNAREWKQWLAANKHRLYFSEGDGYKFIVLPE